MDEPSIGLHPEGDKGLWVFRVEIPGVGRISRGEVGVNTTMADETLSAEVQKAAALEKINVLAQVLLKASERK